MNLLVKLSRHEFNFEENKWNKLNNILKLINWYKSPNYFRFNFKIKKILLIFFSILDIIKI
jgi:hypothetical protein